MGGFSSFARDLFLKVYADDKAVDELFAKLIRIGGVSKATAANLGVFEDAARAGAISTREFNTAIEAAIRNEQRAADEIQRYGRMQALAEIEDKKRTKAILDQAAAQQKLAQSQNLSTARAAGNFGALAGVLPGGASSAVFGVSSLLQSGLSATTVAAAAAVLAIGAVTAAAIKGAITLGEYARAQTDLAERTGLTTRETQLLTRSASLLQIDTGAVTTAMRTLSKGLSENSEEGKLAKQGMAELGITATDSLKPMGPLLTTILEKLGAMQEGAYRDRIAIDILGKGALVLIPLASNMARVTAEIERSGIILDKESIEQATKFQERVKLYGLAWDAFLVKAEKHAQITIDFVTNITDFKHELELARRGPILSDYLGPGSPPPPGQISDPLAAGRSQRLQDVEGISRRYETPGEKLNEQIKSLREKKDLAQRAAEGATNKPEQDRSAAALDQASKALALAEKQRDGLKEEKKEADEILTLREKIAELSAKTLYGEQRINAEYDAQIQKLKEQKKYSPQAEALVGQARDLEKAKNSREEAILQTNRQREIGDAVSNAERSVTSATAARKAKLDQQGFTDRGDTLGGINAAQQDANNAAHAEYQDSLQRSARDRYSAVIKVSQGGNPDALREAQKAAEISDIKAAADLQTKLDNAAIEALIQRGTLQRKNNDEALKAAEEQIKREREYADLVTKRTSAIATGQSRLAVTNAAPGFELQAQLTADAGRLQRDQAESAATQARNSVDIGKLEATPAGKRTAELQKQIDDLKLENAKEVSKIELDTIQARFDAEEKLAQKRNQDEQTFRSSVVGFLDATQHRKGGEYLQGIGQKVLGNIEGNAAGLLFPTIDAIRSPIARAISGTTDKPTIAGQFLAGGPLGPVTIGGKADALAKNPAALLQIASTDKTTDAVINLRDTIVALATGEPLPSGVSTSGHIPGQGAGGSLTSLLGTTGQSSLFTPAIQAGLKAFSTPNANNIQAAVTAVGNLGKIFSGSTSSGDSSITLPFFGSGSTSGSPSDSSVSLPFFGGSGTADAGGVNVPFAGSTSAASAAAASAAAAGSTAAATGIIGSLKALSGSSGNASANPFSTLGNGNSSVAQDIGAGAAVAAAAYGAEQGIVQITKGGTRNIVSGIGKLASSGAALTAGIPVVPEVLGGVALVASVVSAVLGDPRAARSLQISNELNRQAYIAPAAQNRTQDIFGNYASFDKFGHVQTTNLSAVEQVSQGYINRQTLNGQQTFFDVPGTVTSPFSPSTGGQSYQPPPGVTIQFHSIDPKSALDYFRNNPDVANAVIHVGLTHATGPAQAAVRGTVGLR